MTVVGSWVEQWLSGGRFAPYLTEVRGDRTAAVVAPVTTATSTGMKCAKCKDQFVSTAQPPEKMGRRQVVTSVRHECSTCETKTVVTGAGKTRVEKVVHTCKEAGAGHAGCALVNN